MRKNHGLSFMSLIYVMVMVALTKMGAIQWAFPNIQYGKFGDEKVAQSTKINGMSLGQLMVLPDDSQYIHSRASTAAAMTAAYMGQGAAVPADTMVVKSLVLAATVNVGDRTVTITAGGTASIAADQYADGYLIVPAGTSNATSGSRRWAVATNNSAAAASTCVVGLKEAIDVALPAGTVVVGLRENPHWGVIVTSGDTALTAPLAGVAPVAVSAGFYYWAQVKGPTECFVGGTVLTVGDPVFCSTAVAGAVAAIAATTVTDAKSRAGVVGYGMTLGAANGNALVNLSLL